MDYITRGIYKTESILNEYYSESLDDDMETAVTDLMTNILHYARKHGLDVSRIIRMMKYHFEDEGAEIISDEGFFPVECKLWEVDLEENWVKFEAPQAVVNKGFHAGSVKIDFSGVQRFNGRIQDD